MRNEEMPSGERKMRVRIFAILFALMLSLVGAAVVLYLSTTAELTAATTQAEIERQQAWKYFQELMDTQAEMELQRQQASEFYRRLTDTQAELDELRTKPPEIVEVEKEVPRTFREFEGLAELTEWLEKNRLSIVLIADEDGKFDFLNPRTTSRYDCDDYAADLQRKALEQGFLMSQQLILNGKLFGFKVSKHTEPHMGNLTVIGNDIYYIDSVPPHEVVKVACRDK